ncbi:DedA family protein [Nocardioides ochotonae]|uniref:DedA family protein n=1 Tax=Nocardioides ochotonae TaxID=2685869 RepID=UPI001CD6B359|nr:VTT domain-containing protein [Nocardioides ochotonae]
MSALLAGMPLPHPLLLGIDYLDPQWLLAQFGAELFWISLLIIFVECGLFFPFLPGDSLLFALGIFIATGQIDLFPGSRLTELVIAVTVMTLAAWLGNVCGYEIGRRLGPRLRQREGRVLKQKYFDQTEVFFERHGNKALVIGRFVAFVRTYITVVAGITQMPRRRFYTWSAVGGVAWVVLITGLGYFLGHAVPWLEHNIDLIFLVILAFTAVPITFEWWRHRRTDSADAEDNDHDGRPDRDITGLSVTPVDRRE